MSATDEDVARSQASNSGDSLFPVHSQQNAPMSRSSLFPAYTTSSNECLQKSRQNEQPLDWLENKSFGKDTADILSKLQREQEQSEKRSQAESASSDDSQQDGGSVKGKRPRDKDEEDFKALKKKKKKKHKKKHKKKQEKDTEEKSQEIEKETFYKADQGKVFLEEVPGLTPGQAYRVDRSRDQNNWTYGSLYKLHVGKYHSLGSSCLGLKDGAQLLWLRAGKLKHSKKHSGRSERYYGKENRKAVSSQGVLCGRESDTPLNRAEEGISTLHSDFLSLRKAESRELYKVLDSGSSAKSAEVNPLGVYDSSTCSYLQGKTTDKMAADMAANANHDTTTTTNAGSTGRTADFNRRLRDNPNDVKLWLDFVKFQDFNSGLSAGDSEGTELDKLKISSTKVTEKKLSVLEKAIQSNPASIELKIAQLELSKEILEPHEIATQWTQLLFVHPGKTSLWLHYILFVQSNLSQFTVAKTVKCYQSCLTKLTAIMSGNVHLVDDDRPSEEDLLMILFQYCTFLRQTGHTEKAVATLQAMIEFNLFSPHLVKAATSSEKITVFESFWDSGVARFGESGAKGWASSLQNKQLDSQPPSGESVDEEVEETILARDQQVWKTWLEMENHREAVHWLPWRPDLSLDQSEEDCEDPDRLVLVDDVSPVLFTFKKEELNFDLVMMFLFFLGVDIETHYQTKLTKYTGESQLFLESVQETGVDSANLPFPRGEICFAENRVSFVRNIFQQALEVFSEDYKTSFTLLLLDFETKIAESNSSQTIDKGKAKSLRKLTKTLLKEEGNRNNLLLWNWYALLENRLGKAEESLKILETALSMQPAQNISIEAAISEGVIGLVTLYVTYVKVLLGIGESPQFVMGKKCLPISSEISQMVVKTMDCLADGKTFQKSDITSSSTSPMSCLRTRKKFQNLANHLLSKFNNQQNSRDVNERLSSLFSCIVWCSVLYEYATSDLEAVSELIKSFISEVELICESPSIETQRQKTKRQLYAVWLEMAVFHQTVSVCPLKKLQSVLDSALVEFPEDRVFLRLFVGVETQSFITGRLRRYFDKTIRSSETPLPSIYCFAAEIQRHLALIKSKTALDGAVPLHGETGIVHRLRSVFERSLLLPHCQHSPLLWVLYMSFEMDFGDASRAKGIFYRALQKCPWSKLLYKTAVSLFPSQLQELVDLMLEKEIRIQIPVEEIHILRGTEPEVVQEQGAPGELYAQLVTSVRDKD